MRQALKYFDHVVSDNLSGAGDNSSLSISCTHLLSIFFLLFLDARFDIVNKMFKLGEYNSGCESHLFKLRDQLAEVLDLFETTRCQVDQNDWYQFLALFFNITAYFSCNYSIIDSWNVNDTYAVIHYAEFLLTCNLLLCSNLILFIIYFLFFFFLSFDCVVAKSLNTLHNFFDCII